MRTLLAVLLAISAVSVRSPSADAAGKSWRGSGYLPHAGPAYRARRAHGVCEERARHDDPNGTFAGFPCWARSAFGQPRR